MRKIRTMFDGHRAARRKHRFSVIAVAGRIGYRSFGLSCLMACLLLLKVPRFNLLPPFFYVDMEGSEVYRLVCYAFEVGLDWALVNAPDSMIEACSKIQ